MPNKKDDLIKHMISKKGLPQGSQFFPLKKDGYPIGSISNIVNIIPPGGMRRMHILPPVGMDHIPCFFCELEAQIILATRKMGASAKDAAGALKALGKITIKGSRQSTVILDSFCKELKEFKKEIGIEDQNLSYGKKQSKIWCNSWDAKIKRKL